MTRAFLRLAPATTIAAFLASPAFAQDAKIDGADTAWMIGATGLVLMMTIPGLALFYAGMVRKKNVLATTAQSLAATFLVSILWAVVGYSLAFTGDGAAIGTLDRIFLKGMGMDDISPLAKTIPESLFMIYQMTFAIYHGGACRGFGCRSSALLGVPVVLCVLAFAGLCTDRALGVGRRFPRYRWRDRFRRGHGGAPERRRRRTGCSLRARCAAWVWQRQIWRRTISLRR
jgi:hypothetical protein